MKRTNKIILFISVICLAVALSVLSASAYRFDDDIYLDCNNDGASETYIEFYADTKTKTAEISYLETSAESIVIPDSLFSYYTEEDYTVTSISEVNCPELKSVTIPSTVTKIADKSLGWHYDLVYDDYWEDWDEELVKIEGFTVKCAKGSAAETYATKNGFNLLYLTDISYADITLNKTSFVYSGSKVNPTVTVKNKGKLLINGIDYKVSFSNIINAGTANVKIEGIGDYYGSVEKSFEILPVDGTTANFSMNSKCDYTGKAIKPSVTISLNGKTLRNKKDYTITYSANTLPGTASVSVKFIGNYSGSKNLKFKISIAAITNASATALSDNQIKLSWSKVKCSSYSIYKYNSSNGKYELLKSTTATTLTDKNLSQLKTYKYYIIPVVSSNGKNYNGSKVKLYASTLPKTPTIKISTGKNKTTVSWSKNTLADGYQVGIQDYDWYYDNYFESYYSDDSNAIKVTKTIKDNCVTSWSKKIKENDEYTFAVRSFKKVNGKTVYSKWSELKSSASMDARVNAAVLKPHRSFPVYNIQGAKTYTGWTSTISDSDVKTLKKFIKNNFTDKMSREEKLEVTLRWINRNVTYAEGSDWYEIVNLSYVDAIFNHKKGQCVQYNGAMAAMMAYLGYDVSLVQGYRGTWPGNFWQHFWVEVYIDGVTYICETGNYECDGNWSYLMAKYSETRGYIRNQKNM